MSRTLSKPRERILAAAGDLFQRHGIRGVGVEAIAAAAGTNKMTLYRHFGSKDELVAAWIRQLSAQGDAVWAEIAAQHPASPHGQLLAWIAHIAGKLSKPRERGCPFANSVAELPEKNHPARRVIEAHHEKKRRRIVQLCRKAGLREPAIAADELFFLLEGAQVSAQNLNPRRIAQRLPVMAAALLAARTPSRSGKL